MFVDTHAHLTDLRFAEEVDLVLERAQAAGVEWVVSVASDLADSSRTVALAGRSPAVYATVGVHPHAAESFSLEALERLRELSGAERVVAVGETGLDYHYGYASRDAQRTAFRAQLALAAELDRPVVVHAREADAEVIELIREVGWGRGVLHCFDGGAELLEAALELGWYISFSGLITFAGWEKSTLVGRVPLDRILVETDSPYLAPVPRRGRRNEPAFLPHVVARLAELRQEEQAELTAALRQNAHAFYRVEARA